LQAESPEFLKQADGLVEFYRQYPEIAAKDLLNVKLSDVQKVILRAMWFKKYVMAIMSRGSGKTFLNAVVATLKAMLYPGYRVGLLAPTFRQAKYMFDECHRLWQLSPILQAATEKKPTAASDNCYIRFNTSGGRPGSIIQAIPLGDGSKIRGSRFFTIICDEFPHIPSDIFNRVIRPMAATVADPMENVERIQRQEELVKAGVLKEEEISDESANQILITSSGYFTFNHIYPLYCIYRDHMLQGRDDYAAFRVPYTLLPKGFLDTKNVEGSRQEMSSLEFRMEYGAEFIPDTEGFYKASLLESCKSSTFSVQLAGDPDKSYILGIDPARTEDAFAICVIELGKPCRIVNALEFYRQTFPDMARKIETLCMNYNVQTIYMDSQGGGLSIKDILAENNNKLPNGPILDCEDALHLQKKGRHILKLCNFTPEWIADSNFGALRLLENKELLFPEVPFEEANERLALAWETVNAMKSQMQLIIVSETPTGKVHFDVPKGGGHGKQKKDLYTAFLIACRGAYDTLWAEEVPVNVLHHSGLLIPREDRGVGYTFSNQGPTDEMLPGSLQEKMMLIQNPEQYKVDLLRSMAGRRQVLTSPSAVLKPRIKGK